MSIFNFLKKNKSKNSDNESTYSDIRQDKPFIITLSEPILDAIPVCDIIYAEVAESGACGYAGQAMLYVIQDEQLVCYATSIFENADLYEQIKELLFSHSDIKNVQTGEVLFKYYYGGLGNNVFINNSTPLSIADEHFTLDKNNTQYRIHCSVLGVFDCVACAMQESEA